MIDTARTTRITRVAASTLVASGAAGDLGACVLVLRVDTGLSPVTLLWVAYAALLSVVSALALVLRSPARERLVWTIGGLVLGFAILGGFSIGPAFLPAAGLLLLGGLVGDVIGPRLLLVHVPLAVVACVLQVAAPLFVLHTLTPPL